MLVRGMSDCPIGRQGWPVQKTLGHRPKSTFLNLSSCSGQGRAWPAQDGEQTYGSPTWLACTQRSGKPHEPLPAVASARNTSTWSAASWPLPQVSSPYHAAEASAGEDVADVDEPIQHLCSTLHHFMLLFGQHLICRSRVGRQSNPKSAPGRQPARAARSRAPLGVLLQITVRSCLWQQAERLGLPGRSI